VDASDASNLKDQIEKTSALTSGEDPAALERALEELSRLSYSLTEKLYATLGGEDEEIAAEVAAAGEADSDSE